MDLLVCWVLFPALVLALAVGWGGVVEAVCGRRLPLALLPALGFAAIVVVGQFLTIADATAELTAPVVAVLGACGLLALRDRPGPSRWGMAAVAAVFAIYAAPIVLSGEATFAGFIRLDDTATWMALTDRVMEHGRSLDGLAPSSYEATLAFNLGDGYPVGALLPLGIGAELSGQDVAWVIQPYMAWLGAVLALALWALARSLVRAPSIRAACALLAAQPALLYGYYLWGGIKELAAAALIASVAAVVATLAGTRLEARALLPLAVLCAALVGCISAGGLLWLAPILALGLVPALRALGARVALGRAVLLGGLLTVLCLPALIAGPLPPTSSPLTDPGARGNLIEPLAPAQAAGIWPAGDFRLEPDHELLAYLLIALVLAAAAGGFATALARRDWGTVAYVGGALVACTANYLAGSPWVDAKALAIASAAVLLAAGIGAASLLGHGRPVWGSLVLAALAAGLVWSNALAYREVNLAPREQLAELGEIGELVAAEGPTLMTEYNPYGVRHFLREADPEGVSELRRRRIPLRDGTLVGKGGSADTDRIDPAALAVYRTLVVRRSPMRSRPPNTYRLVWRGEFYEAWQRPPSVPELSPRLPLGDPEDPAAEPRCNRVLDLAARGDLVAAPAPRLVIEPLSATAYPSAWSIPGSSDAPVPTSPGSIEATVAVRRPGEYEVWLGGSVRSRAELLLDGDSAGEAHHQLNNDGGYVSLGTAALEAGRHRVEVRVGGGDLGPGSGGRADPIGPLALSAASPKPPPPIRVASTEARELCGREWDWIELDR